VRGGTFRPEDYKHCGEVSIRAAKLYIEWKEDHFEVEQIVFSIDEFHFSHIQHRNTLVFHTNRFSILFHLHWYVMSCPIKPVWTISVKKRKSLLL
jgi:hypothetical protein